jgi:hypothetical protein
MPKWGNKALQGKRWEVQVTKHVANTNQLSQGHPQQYAPTLNIASMNTEMILYLTLDDA